MLTQLEKRKKQWGGRNRVIDNWLQERQQVLVAYCELIGLQPDGTAEPKLPESKQVNHFCQLLMDYISAGHFEIFNNIVEQCKDKGPADKSKANEVFPKLNQSTDLALKFNDNFAENSTNKLPINFDLQLATLGRALEERFLLEDELLAMLYHY